MNKAKNRSSQASILRRTRSLWREYAPKYYWGDPMDVRFYLCKQLAKVHGKRILDIGCNAGIIISSADNSNTKIGIDTDADAIRIARRINKDLKLNARFIVKDAFKSNIRPGSMDVLVLANVLPSFDYPGYTEADCREFIRRSTSLLKKGGKLYLTTPNGQNRYYSRKHKISYGLLKDMLGAQYDFIIRGWNPVPLILGHGLQYIPFWFGAVEWINHRGLMTRHCASFYVEAKKKY
jgi:2-polyprenyl-3-methyl-5-hydroxy-6-metoxy-1,4-benzoquinol methylase